MDLGILDCHRHGRFYSWFYIYDVFNMSNPPAMLCKKHNKRILSQNERSHLFRNVRVTHLVKVTSLWFYSSLIYYVYLGYNLAITPQCGLVMISTTGSTSSILSKDCTLILLRILNKKKYIFSGVWWDAYYDYSIKHRIWYKLNYLR